MSATDWPKLYAAMDKRLELKYAQLPNGEQIGKSPGEQLSSSGQLRTGRSEGSGSLRQNKAG